MKFKIVSAVKACPSSPLRNWSSSKLAKPNPRAMAKRIAKIDPETNQIVEIFDTVTEAKQKTHSHVDRALKDPNKILAGFKWQYID